MKILISGTTGFIGKNISKKLIEAGNEIYAVVRPRTDKTKIDPLIKIFVYNDNINELIDFLKKNEIEGVLHLASLFLTQHKSEDIPGLLDSNIVFPTLLLEASVKSSVRWFINTGTFWQHFKSLEYSPVNLYAATKQAFEDVSKYYAEEFGLNFVTIKLFGTFGPGDTRSKVFNLWSKISQSEERLDMSPGKQIIDMSYIEDIISGYLKMIELLSKDYKNKYSGQCFFIQSPQRLTLRKMAKLFEKVSGKKLNINWGGRPYLKREVMRPVSGGKKIPGWKSKFSLEESIRETLNK